MNFVLDLSIVCLVKCRCFNFSDFMVERIHHVLLMQGWLNCPSPMNSTTCLQITDYPGISITLLNKGHNVHFVWQIGNSRGDNSIPLTSSLRLRNTLVRQEIWLLEPCFYLILFVNNIIAMLYIEEGWILYKLNQIPVRYY